MTASVYALTFYQVVHVVQTIFYLYMNTYGSKMYDDYAGTENIVFQMHHFLTRMEMCLVRETVRDSRIESTYFQLDLEPVEIQLGSNLLSTLDHLYCIHSKNEHLCISFPYHSSTAYKIYLAYTYLTHPGILL